MTAQSQPGLPLPQAVLLPILASRALWGPSPPKAPPGADSGEGVHFL